jgi:hypothetical protein
MRIVDGRNGETYLIVSDIDAGREELMSRGATVSEVRS